MEITKFFTKRQGVIEGTTEGIDEIRETLSLDLGDDELIRIIDKRIATATQIKSTMDKIDKQNEDFYLGKQLEDYEIAPGKSGVIDNKIFLSVDTIVPILATKKREPVVMAAQDNDESRELAQIAQEYLSWKYLEQRMTLKLADLIRLFSINRIVALKYRFVPGKYNDFIVEVKRPDCLYIDNKANEDDQEFMAEMLEETVELILDKFAIKDGKIDKSKKEKILEALNLTDKDLGTKVKYIEFWTNEFVVWKMGTVILDKAKNPNWLWDTEGKKYFNHFRAPRKPYILFRQQSLLKGAYGDTTPIEQAIPIQKNINKRKQQISDNADQASGTWIFNGRYISKKEASKFRGAANEHLFFTGEENSEPKNAVDRLLPKDLGVQVFNDLMDDKSEVDNIFGTHSTTRGERGAQKTLGEATMLKQSDFGRLDLMSQYIDAKVVELYDAFIQMTLVYYDEMKTLKILGTDNSQKYIDFSRDNLDEGIEIIINSEPLLEKADEMQKYVQLFEAGIIDPLTMFERLNLPNPKELTRRKLLLDIDPKMYLAEFVMDENTPGMEKDPVTLAKKDIRELEEGEVVPPQPVVEKAHIEEHVKHIKSQHFENLKKDIKANTAEHIKAELQKVKEDVASVGGAQQPAQPAQPPMGGMQPPAQPQAPPMTQPQI